MTTKNPFAPAAKVSKRLKVLIYGASGVGKTLAALSFPRPAVIDSEAGTDMYSGRDGIPSFDILRAKSFEDLQRAIDFIKADNGATYDTLIVDSVSVFYDVQKEAASKGSGNGDLGFREWGKINNRMVYLYNALTNLPVHVVVIAREAIEYETRGKEMIKVGTKPDADKRLVYMFDFVVNMRKDRSGVIDKSRGVSLGDSIKAVTYATFAKAAELFTDGAHVVTPTEERAIAQDARAYDDTKVFWDSLKRRFAESLNESNQTLAVEYMRKMYAAKTINATMSEDDVFEQVITSTFQDGELLDDDVAVAYFERQGKKHV